MEMKPHTFDLTWELKKRVCLCGIWRGLVLRPSRQPHPRALQDSNKRCPARPPALSHLDSGDWSRHVGDSAHENLKGPSTPASVNHGLPSEPKDYFNSTMRPATRQLHIGFVMVLRRGGCGKARPSRGTRPSPGVLWSSHPHLEATG